MMEDSTLDPWKPGMCEFELKSPCNPKSCTMIDCPDADCPDAEGKEKEMLECQFCGNVHEFEEVILSKEIVLKYRQDKAGRFIKIYEYPKDLEIRFRCGDCGASLDEYKNDFLANRDDESFGNYVNHYFFQSI